MLTVILTGGKSVRMGRDKARLPSLPGGVMSEMLIDRYRESLGPVAVSVNSAGRFAHSGAIELVDSYPGRGPLNGLYSAFTQTDADVILLTATDLPNGDPELAKRLLRLIGDADACVIRLPNGYLEPLFAVYKRSCLEAAKSAIEGSMRSLASMMPKVSVRYVEESELPEWDLGHVLMNVNTPEDYERYRSDGRHIL